MATRPGGWERGLGPAAGTASGRGGRQAPGLPHLLLRSADSSRGGLCAQPCQMPGRGGCGPSALLRGTTRVAPQCGGQGQSPRSCNVNRHVTTHVQSASAWEDWVPAARGCRRPPPRASAGSLVAIPGSWVAFGTCGSFLAARVPESLESVCEHPACPGWGAPNVPWTGVASVDWMRFPVCPGPPACWQHPQEGTLGIPFWVQAPDGQARALRDAQLLPRGLASTPWPTTPGSLLWPDGSSRAWASARALMPPLGCCLLRRSLLGPSNYSYPPCTLTDEETRAEMMSRELQISQREKQEILAFEGHLAAASTKQTITESSSLLLSQLTSLDPKYALHCAELRAGPGLGTEGAVWSSSPRPRPPLSWFSLRQGSGDTESLGPA